MNKLDNIAQILSWANTQLAEISQTPALDARVLLQHVGDFSSVDLILKSNQALPVEQLDTFTSLIKKRKAGMPIAYLTGIKEFWSLNLRVTTDTLIPRPETETLVEAALGLVPQTNPGKILDLGTGSGAIAIALAHERPKFTVVATDQSLAALNIAVENSANHKINNINFINSDWFNALDDQKFDLIVSNPPYIAERDHHFFHSTMQCEPTSALTSGMDGLRDLTLIITQAHAYLSHLGWLIVEHGYDQKESVKKLFTDNQFRHIACLTDIQGHPRITKGQFVNDLG